jgi:hypothetical protein
MVVRENYQTPGEDLLPAKVATGETNRKKGKGIFSKIYFEVTSRITGFSII